MIVVCQTPGCGNEGAEIDVVPPPPEDREGWVIVCGVCGRPIAIPASP